MLRGINVGGHNQIPMTELRSLCSDLGWMDVQTYIQSGNLVFKALGSEAKLEKDLEQAIEGKFGLSIHTIIRAGVDWTAYLRGNPFPDESQSEPSYVQLALSKASPKSDAVTQLQERAAGGERIIRVGDALWIYFKNGVGKSKLTPALLDRLVGSPVTMRNWRTVLKLGEMANVCVTESRME